MPVPENPPSQARISGAMAHESDQQKVPSSTAFTPAYAGDITPEEAWKLLVDDPEAVLVDCRTDAEWRFVGVPDLSSPLEPRGRLRRMEQFGRQAQRRFRRGSEGRRRHARVKGRWCSCAAPATAPSAPPRPRPRLGSRRPTTCWTASKAISTSTGTAAAPAGRPSACPGGSHEHAKTIASEDRSEAQVDGANRKLPREARTGAGGSRVMKSPDDQVPSVRPPA